MIERRVRQLLAIPEMGILVALVLVTAIFWLINPVILKGGIVASLLRAIPFVGIIAIGQTLLLIVGELDLSVGSVAGLCAIIAGSLMEKVHWPLAHSPDAHWPVVAALAVGMLTGAVIGLVNGLLAVGLGIPAFIVTLGMLYIAQGFTYLLCGGNPIYPLPDSLTAFGNASPNLAKLYSWLIPDASPIRVSWAFFIFLGLAILGQVTLSRTVFGRAIYATGGNREVARIAGIRTGAVKISCYVLTGTLAALAGILQMAQLTSGQPEIGLGWELNVIASVVIGGVSLFGGIGSVTGTVLGLILMQVVRSGLVTSGVNTHWQTASVGGIMIAAVGLDLLRRRAKILE